jgi:hypothetical protein
MSLDLITESPVFEGSERYPSRCPVCGRGGEPEALLKLSEIARALNVPLFAVRRAAKKGDFPTYQVSQGHRRARLSEVIAAIEAHV